MNANTYDGIHNGEFSDPNGEFNTSDKAEHKAVKDRIVRRLGNRFMKSGIVNRVVVGRGMHRIEGCSQKSIRAAFPARVTFCMNLANGWFGYFPPNELYGEDVYSVWQSPFAEGALEILIDKCKEGLSECAN